MNLNVEKYIEMQQIALFSEDSKEIAADRILIQSGVRFYCENCFTIPAPIVSKYLRTYKLIYWHGFYLLATMQAGMIERDGIAYRIRFHRNLTRGFILKNKEQQFALSFREPSDSNLYPYVLISSSSSSAS
jgi:hypothetical protein